MPELLVGNLDTLLLRLVLSNALAITFARITRRTAFWLVLELPAILALTVAGHVADQIFGLYSTAPVKDPLRNILLILLIFRLPIVFLLPILASSRQIRVRRLARFVIRSIRMSASEEHRHA